MMNTERSVAIRCMKTMSFCKDLLFVEPPYPILVDSVFGTEDGMGYIVPFKRPSNIPRLKHRKRWVRSYKIAYLSKLSLGL